MSSLYQNTSFKMVFLWQIIWSRASKGSMCSLYQEKSFKIISRRQTIWSKAITKGSLYPYWGDSSDGAPISQLNNTLNLYDAVWEPWNLIKTDLSILPRINMLPLLSPMTGRYSFSFFLFAFCFSSFLVFTLPPLYQCKHPLKWSPKGKLYGVGLVQALCAHYTERSPLELFHVGKPYGVRLVKALSSLYQEDSFKIISHWKTKWSRVSKGSMGSRISPLKVSPFGKPCRVGLLRAL